MNIKYGLAILCSLPKTIYFNFKCFTITEAIKLPVLVGYRTRIGYLHKNCIHIEDKSKRVHIGFKGTEGIESKYSYISLSKESRVYFGGVATMGENASIILENGLLEIGDNFKAEKGIKLFCNCHMLIGEGVIIEENVTILDFNKEADKDKGNKSVFIGDNVRIGKGSYVLRGAKIGKGSTVEERSMITAEFMEGNCILGENPEKIEG